jgi:lipooligosaccharide transport system permease protein
MKLSLFWLSSGYWQWPRLRFSAALRVVYRNFLVWQRLMGASLALNFGQPLLYMLGIGIGLGFFVGEMDGLPYLTFLATGLAASAAMNTSTFEGMYSSFSRMVPQRTFEAILATPLDLDDIILAEWLWAALKGTFAGFAIVLVAFFLGAIAPSFQAWLLLIPLLFLISLSFAGFALLMSALAANYDFFEYYFTLVITPSLLICGVFYPISTLPDWLEPWVFWLPLTQAIELLRPLLVGLPWENFWLSLSVLAVLALLGFYLAVVFTRKRLIF